MTYLLTTSGTGVAAMVDAVRETGPVTVVAVGARAVADAAAAGAPESVLWCPTASGVPAEAYAVAVAKLVAQAGPDLVVARSAPAERALLGAAAAALGAVLLPGGRSVVPRTGHLVVERTAVGGAVVQTLEVTGPLAVLLDVDDDVPGTGATAIEQVTSDPTAGIQVFDRESTDLSSGLTEAAKVVGVGRGLSSRADLELVTSLAERLGAEVGCSMPVADDLGWLEKSRYIGRSGQTIAPRLYLAVGISGAPQHLEGIRGAKVVAAIDRDPDAPIFRRADYGIAGDLHEVVPALIEALAR